MRSPSNSSIENNANNEFQEQLGKGIPAEPLAPGVKQQVIIASLQSRLAENPKDWRLHLQLADVYYKLYETKKALSSINMAWDLIPSPTVAMKSTRACVLAEYANEYGGSKSLLHEAISLFESLSAESSDGSVPYNIGNFCLGDSR